MTVVVLLVLAAVHSGAGATGPSLLTSIRDGAVLLPLALVAAAAAALLSELMNNTWSRACSGLAGALGGGAVLGLLTVPAGAAQQYLFSPQLPAASLTHRLSEAVLTWLAASTALLCVEHGRRVTLACRAVRPARPVAVSVAVALAAQTGALFVFASPAAAAPAPSCVQTRSYDVAVIDLEIPFNRWGDRDANGMMYVLQKDKDAVRSWDVPLGKKRGATMGTYVGLAPGEAELAGGRRLRPRPLVLRANIGDCVNVTVTNELTGPQLGGKLTDPRVSMQVNGAAYDVQTSDGSAVGFNADTTIAVGQSLTYAWAAPAQEGVYLIRDRGIPAASEADGGSVVHGLFGGLAVEPAGSTWTDPESGARLDSATPYMDPITRRQSGELYIHADITPPTPAGQVPQSFRESVQLAQDEIPGIGFGFNYGSEPSDRRQASLCPDCVGEETSLSSWAYGDPALVKLASGLGPWKPTPGKTDLEDCGLPVLAADGTPRKDQAGKALVSCYTSNVTHAYKKDKTKIRYGLAGVKETHVFHMHAHQWFAEPEDTKTAANGNPESMTVDSQTFGPGEMFTADLIGGAGSVPGTAGDTIFHCHLYPHFAEGFWSLLRVHDVLEDGNGALPDGINVRNLEPLPGGLLPVKPTADNPGYPHFIPGKVGWRAPQPFGGVSQPSGTPDNPGTVDREDLALAPRMVAGRVLDPSLLEKEQKITISGAGGGAQAATFTLSFSGQTTDPALPAGSTAAQVEAALETLTTLDDVAVVGSGSSADPYRVRLVAFGATSDLVIGTSTTAKNVPDPALVGPDAADVASRLALERTTLRKAYGGAQPKAGAPLTDPCPAGARQVVYNVSVIQRELIYNEAGWRDTQGRLYVLDKDVAAVMAGSKKPEPLFFRVNAGDCISFNLTNRLPNWTGGDAFVELAQANMIGAHVHLVKFDVLGSDGSSNGWNYQQAAFTEDQAAFNNRIAAGTQACTVAATCRLPKPSSYSPENAPIASGQTISERWYADRELRTAFTHDHHFPALVQNRGQYGALIIEPKDLDTRNPQTGEYYQPINNPANGPVCGSACTGSADGTQRDIVGPGTNDDFREFGLSFQDFVPLTKKGGNPRLRSDTLNPPAAPEVFPDADPGVMGINYTNAPFLLRDTKNGQPIDPAYRFSSTLFGDPATPLLQAYAGDPVRIRLIQGSQEEQHVWSMNGVRWRDEPDDPQAPLVNSKALGISDAMNFEVPQMACGIDEDCRGDYLYSSTSVDATYLGMWGLMRVYGKGTPKLLPLPDNTPQAANGNLNQTVTGTPPDPVPAGKKGGAPCPTTASPRTFDVFATDGKIVYNKAGDNDPYGLMYGLVLPGETSDQAVARVRQQQEPLVLRANAGDCIEVTLTNRIDPAGAFAVQHADQGAADTSTGGDPRLPLEPPTGTKAGLRVSLHPQLVRYDVRYSDGAVVGFNRDQTVGPGQTITQRWWADEVSPGELGATNLVDFGDVRGHRHHGLFAGLIIEPKGSVYTDPISGESVSGGASADIRVPGAADFRENVPFFQDGLNLRDINGAAILPPSDPAHPGITLDAEDGGEKAFSYRSAAFRHRGDPLHERPGAPTGPMSGSALADVFSSKVNGDPDTKVFRAYGGDPVRMRVLQGSDKPRQHSFQVAAQAWRAQPDDPGSRLVGSQGGMSVMRALNVELASAGGLFGNPGDYMYNCGVAFHHLSGGLWGISRVYAAPATGHFVPSALGTGADPLTGDNPRRTGYQPIQPLEQQTVTAVVFDDANSNRLQGSEEKLLAGVPVQLYVGNSDGTTGALLETRKTNLTGRAAFSVPAGAYDLVVPAPADFAATTPKTMRLSATKDGSPQSADFGQVQLANLAVRAYNDRDGNAAYTTGETSMEGWNVTLTGQGKTASMPITGGVAPFGDLLPGSYSATVTPGAGYYSTTHKTMPVSITVLENADLTGNPVAGQAGTGEIRVGYALKAGVSVRVFNDSNDNGAQEAGETSLASRRLDVKGGPEGAVLASTATDAAGNATLDDPDPAIDGLVPGTYSLTETPGPDWKLTDKASRVVTRADGTTADKEQLPATGSTVTLGVQQGTSQIVTLPNHNPKGWVSVVPYNDLNNDGVRQDKEGKLVGWHTELYLNGVLKGSTSTDNGGKATWYVDLAGGVQAPVSYTVKMAPQEVASTEIPWTATTSGSVIVKAVSGEDRSASFGFVRLGTIQAIAWHDLDRDGIDSGRGEVLADRTVRLYDSGGKTLLQQKVTDASGMASFKASAGIDYQLEVLLPIGWTATAPFAANGSPVTKLKVVGPSSLASVLTRFGQYNTNDRTPPPDPTATATAGTDGAQTVALTSEAGASFRYTLDGDLPSATTGMTYTGPVTISSSKTLKAVAIDVAGNASGVMVADYIVVGGATAPPAAPGTWTPTTGTTRGALSDLAVKDDGLRYFLTSAASGPSYVTEGYGTYVVPTGRRQLLGLGVAFEGRASIAGVTRSLEMYNWATRKYEVVRDAEAEALTDACTIVDVDGDPKRFMKATTGEIRLRVRGSAAKSFEIGADQVAFTVRYTS